MIHLEKWFSTPIWYGNFKEISDFQYENAIKYCLDLSKKTPGVTKSNVGGWQSESLSLLDIQNTSLAPFFNEIQQELVQAFEDINLSPAPIVNLWVNVNYKNHYNGFHNHPCSSLSGVFYLTEDNSKIIFQREETPSTSHLHWLLSADPRALEDIKNGRLTDLNFKEVSYDPEKGMFLIFPAWIKHSVAPSVKDSARISVAFNCQYKT